MEAESSRLDQAMDTLKLYVDNLSDENSNLTPLVEEATEHAHKLRQQAEVLERYPA
jgi:FtsZ-binding cell division protein ZapB